MPVPTTPLNAHHRSGDYALEFVHERDWLRVARAFNSEGVERLKGILEGRVLPDGKIIDRWEEDLFGEIQTVRIYIREDRL